MTSTLDKTVRKDLTLLRRGLKNAIGGNDTAIIDDALTKLILFNVSLKFKCERLSVKSILAKNCTTPASWDYISIALGILDRYAGNLLLPENERPNGWQNVMTTNDVFKKKIEPILGAEQVLGDIGYSTRTGDRLTLAGPIKHDNILWMKVDLKIAKCELDLYKSAQHPYPHHLDSLVGFEARIVQDPDKQKLVLQRRFAETITNPSAPTISPSTPPIVSTTATSGHISPLTTVSPGVEREPSKSWDPELLKKLGGVSISKAPSLYPSLPPSTTSVKPPSKDASSSITSSEKPVGQPNEPTTPQATDGLSSVPLLAMLPSGVTSQDVRSSGYDPTSGHPLSQPTSIHPLMGSAPPMPSQLNTPSVYVSASAPYQTLQHPASAYVPWPLTADPSHYSAYSQQQYLYDINRFVGSSGPYTPYQFGGVDPSVQYPIAYSNSAPPRPNLPGHSPMSPNAQYSQWPVGAPSPHYAGAPPTQYAKGSPQKKKPKTADKPKAPQKQQQTREEDNSGEKGFLKKIFGYLTGESGVPTDAEPAKQPNAVSENIWMGVALPKRYVVDLLKAGDENARHQLLKDFIATQEVVLINFDEKLNEIIISKEDYHSDVDYQTLTRNMSDTKRVLLLLKKALANFVKERKTTGYGAGAGGDTHCGSGDGSGERMVWACAYCTSRNHMTANICSTCGKTADTRIAIPQEAPAPVVQETSTKTDEKTVESEMVIINKLLSAIQVADEQGFTAEQFEFAHKMCRESRLGEVDWLKENWRIMVDYVADDLTKDEGGIVYTRDEIEGALGRCDGGQDAAALCRQEHHDLLISLEACYKTLTQQTILEVLNKHNGDAHAASTEMNNIVLQPLIEELHHINVDDVEDNVLMSLLRDESISDERRFVSLISERQLGDRDAECVLQLMEVMDDHILDERTLSDVIEAVLDNKSSIDGALNYLHRECPLCYQCVSESKMCTMFVCQCKLCRNCVIQYYEVKILNSSANSFHCPVCEKPDLNIDGPEQTLHLQMLDILLHQVSNDQLYTCFQQKILDWRLCQNDRFRWCPTDSCGNGFLFEPDGVNQLRMTCAKCLQSICFKCQQKWEKQHEGVTCEVFADWKEKNNPELQAAGIKRLLQENGIDCPKCKSRFILARGGCLHFICTNCKYQFCSGCNQEMTTTCTRFANCGSRGFHAHHPRDCLYHLRDEDCETLERLLKERGVNVRENEPQAGIASCVVMEQKERPEGLVDEACGRDLYKETDACLMHYREYLVNLLNRHHIDPIVLMDANKLLAHLNEYQIVAPNYSQMSVAEQLRLMRLYVQEKLPLRQ